LSLRSLVISNEVLIQSQSLAMSRLMRSTLILTTTMSMIIHSWIVSLPIGAAEPSSALPSQGKHRVLTDNAPPGYIAAARAADRGPVHGYIQPVSFHGPQGVAFSMPMGETFGPTTEKFWAGLTVGGVYRFRVTGIPNHPGAELYPTIEMIDRTYPPPGLALRYPVQIDLDEEDLLAALDGQMVTRVVYLEDTDSAPPIAQDDVNRRPIDIAIYQDALEVADRMGRPLAIVRIGSMTPPHQPELMAGFCFGYPVWYPIHFPEDETSSSVSQP
jgi:hypothetical protein